MKKCKDCEREYIDDFIRPKKQICKICDSRIINASQHGKEYVKLKDLEKEEQDKYINKYFGRVNKREEKDVRAIVEGKDVRAVVEGKEQNNYEKIENIEEKETNVDIKQDTNLARVVKDVDTAFEKANISKKYLEFNQLPEIIEQLYLLVRNNEIVDNTKDAETIFNNIQTDYSHLLENADWSDMDKIVEIALLEKSLKYLRRPTKNILTYIKILEPVLNKINDYPVLVKEIENAHKKIKELDDTYYVKASQIVAKEECGHIVVNDDKLNPTQNYYRSYECSVACFNLYRNPNKTDFKTENPIWAKDETEALYRFKKFLADKFPNVTYMEKDIVIREIEKED